MCRNRTRGKLLIISVMVISATMVFAGAMARPAKIRVKVEVVGDQNVDAEVRKYITRALNLLDDVEVVDEEPRVYVHVIARRLITNRGRRLGYVVASATSEIMEMVVEGGRPITLGDYNGLWLEMGPNLRTLCDQCVLAADAGVLRRIRAIDKGM